MTALLVLVVWLFLPPVGQTARREEQIKDLLKKSDLVVVAVAETYHQVLDRIKYERERERGPVLDPLRAERYTLGILYQMTVREVIYRDPERAREGALVGQPGEKLLIYVPGRLADPREFGKAAFLPGGEYLLFVKEARLDPKDFPQAAQRISGAPPGEWPPFPDPRRIYYTPVRDPFATLLLEGAWKDFLLHTRAVVRAHASGRR